MNVAAHKQRPNLHPLERALVVALVVELLFLPWAFGSTRWWSQAIAAVLAAICFALSLWPRDYSGDLAVSTEFRLVAWPRLMRFAPFWFGLGVLALVLIQALNPAWEYQANAKVWWMRGVPHLNWLPAGATAPFEIFNAWRALIIYGTVWLSACAAWVGLTRRRSLQLLLTIVAGNAVVLAGVGFAHRMVGEPKLLWVWRVPGTHFASFVYKNHAGAYLGLIASVAMGLALWYHFDSRKRMARSSPAPLWILLTIVLFLAVIFSFSRGAAITLAVFFVSAVGAYFVLRSANPVPSTMPRVVGVSLAVLFAGALFAIVRYVDFDHLERGFRNLTAAGDASVTSRAAVRNAAWDMYTDHWLLGTGAGSFRYLFPTYLPKHPDVPREVWWDAAHIDWLEIPIELGLSGVLLIGGVMAWCLVRFWRHAGWRHPIAVMVFLGCGQTLLHALVDFPFQNPAVLVTWVTLLIIALRWLELETPERGGQRGDFH